MTSWKSGRKWKEVAGERCLSDAYKRTEIKEWGDITKTVDDVVKMAFTTKGDVNRNRMWERFPELLNTEEEFALLEQTTRIRTSSDIRAARKAIRVTVGGSDVDLWEKLCRVREETEGDEAVAFQQPHGKTVSRIRKMLECVFLHACIYTNNRERSDRKTRNKIGTGAKETDTYGLVVEGTKKKPYTEILKRVKESVRGSKTSGKIRGLKSTKDGRLLITMDKDETAVRVTKAGQRVKEMTVHIRGVDALTARQDVIEAVEKKVG